MFHYLSKSIVPLVNILFSAHLHCSELKFVLIVQTWYIFFTVLNHLLIWWEWILYNCHLFIGRWQGPSLGGAVSVIGFLWNTVGEYPATRYSSSPSTSVVSHQIWHQNRFDPSSTLSQSFLVLIQLNPAELIPYSLSHSRYAASR